MADIEGKIAAVLAEHRGNSDPDGAPERLCECGFTSEYLISDEFYAAVSTYPTFDEAAETAAFERVECEIEAHQAAMLTPLVREAQAETWDEGRAVVTGAPWAVLARNPYRIEKEA